MAASGGRASRGSRPSSRRSGSAARGASAKPAPRKPAPRPTPAAPAFPAGPFRLGAVEGATPGKWIDTWHDRMPQTLLELVPLELPDQRTAVIDGSVDAAIVRLPIESAGLHTIALYDEVPVVVCAADSHLTAADELTLADLVGEVVIAPRHPPLVVDVPGAVPTRFSAPDSVAAAIELAATGAGVVIVPLSLARLHHRKDAAHRPLVDGPLSPVALVWPAAGETPALVDAFIGIVRGRTANSSR